MIIQPNKTASKRTKERISQHGPNFIVEDNMESEFFGCKCFLLRSVKTDWLGWLPEVEITIISD